MKRRKSADSNRVEIVKIQLPLKSTEDDPNALIYNEDRSFYEFIPVSEGLLEVMDGSVKDFFYVAFLEDDSFHLIKKAKYQDW